jgi:hypothetical protein
MGSPRAIVAASRFSPRMNPSISKRQKERERQEHQRAKAERRKQRREEKTPKVGGSGEDPDIAGIIPGPQAPIEE